MAKFKPYTAYSCPTIKISVTELIPSNHVAKFIEQFIWTLDTSEIEKNYSPLGQGGYHPKLLLTIIFYGYMTGIRSGRNLGKACSENLVFIYLSRGYSPQKSTFNDFRLKYHSYFTVFFLKVLEGCEKEGLVDASLSIFDGSKIRANASTKQTRQKSTYKKWLSYLEEDLMRIETELLEIKKKQ